MDWQRGEIEYVYVYRVSALRCVRLGVLRAYARLGASRIHVGDRVYGREATHAAGFFRFLLRKDEKL